VPVVLFTLWVIFNAKLNLEIAVTGIFVTAFVYRFMCKYMGYHYRMDMQILRTLPATLRYIAVLVWQVLVSNMEVSRFVLQNRVDIKPQFVFFKADLKTDTARVILAHSITLTPGTITVSEDDGVFGVHCLNSHMAEGMDNSDFVTILKEMEAKMQ